ncbi:WD40 repeat domain-containing protein [Constantimarinum furrinae]|uniref:Uncharacterized protein n=1 Tax=Constantimarinum furrinae TaxID=2562285 RepID=A0A7G8PUW7_9FLAO|nr:hypothetical protein [Constantimarinum furrinae]QNJ98133.1 hypothetical protein ALE3EI_1575 [Constantimarinum furrinae]
MNKVSTLIILSCLILICMSCHQNKKENNKKLTAINPLAYTSVIYTSHKDTVLVSTYSGRIARRIQNDDSEYVIATINDEIYAMAYSNKRNEIIVATLNSGILILNNGNGKIIRKLSVENGWTNWIEFTKDENYLFTTDVKGMNHIWDVTNHYSRIQLPDSFLDRKLSLSDESGKFYFSSQDKTFIYNHQTEGVEDTLTINGHRAVDVDNQGNLLLLNHNECILFDKNKDSVVIKVSHPNWIYFKPNGEVLAEIPLSMKLTKAKFSKDKVYTAGIDRSIRVWDKKTGLLLENWTGHKATISDMQISKNKNQLVSVDLKGIIKFWDLE